MRKTLAIMVAVTSFLGGATAGFAQEETSGQWYVTGAGTDRMVYGPGSTEGTSLLRGENGAAPSNCPAGSFYEGDDQLIRSCGGDASYSLAAPESGTMMENGQPYPEGAMLMREGE